MSKNILGEALACLLKNHRDDLNKVLEGFSSLTRLAVSFRGT